MGVNDVLSVFTEAKSRQRSRQKVLPREYMLALYIYRFKKKVSSVESRLRRNNITRRLMVEHSDKGSIVFLTAVLSRALDNREDK